MSNDEVNTGDPYGSGSVQNPWPQPSGFPSPFTPSTPFLIDPSNPGTDPLQSILHVFDQGLNTSFGQSVSDFVSPNSDSMRASLRCSEPSGDAIVTYGHSGTTIFEGMGITGGWQYKTQGDRQSVAISVGIGLGIGAAVSPAGLAIGVSSSPPVNDLQFTNSLQAVFIAPGLAATIPLTASGPVGSELSTGATTNGWGAAVIPTINVEFPLFHDASIPCKNIFP